MTLRASNYNCFEYREIQFESTIVNTVLNTQFFSLVQPAQYSCYLFARHCLRFPPLHTRGVSLPGHIRGEVLLHREAETGSAQSRYEGEERCGQS